MYRYTVNVDNHATSVGYAAGHAETREAAISAVREKLTECFSMVFGKMDRLPDGAMQRSALRVDTLITEIPERDEP